MFVTGASGFVGKNICLHFLQKIRRFWADSIRNICGGSGSYSRNLATPGEWQDQIKTVDIVVHCAGNPKFGNGHEYYNDNVECTENLLKVSKESISKLEKFIFVSSVAAMDRAFGDDCAVELREGGVEAPSTITVRVRR